MDVSVLLADNDRVLQLTFRDGQKFKLRGSSIDDAREWKKSFDAISNSSPMLTVASDALTEMGYKFDLTTAGGVQVITSKFTPESLQGNTLLLIVTAERDGFIQCLSKIFSSSPVDKHPIIIETIHRANYGIRVGFFQMDPRDGEILYKCELPLSLSNTPVLQLKNMIKVLISSNLSTHDRYFRAFRAVLYEGKDAATAIEIVEGPTITPSVSDATTILTSSNHKSSSNNIEIVLEICKAILLKAGIEPKTSDGGIIGSCDYQQKKFIVKITISPALLVMVLSTYHRSSPVQSRNALVEVVTRANYGLRIGQFILDYRDGEMMFQSEVPLSTALSVENMIEVLAPVVAANIQTHQKYLPAFQAILRDNSKSVDGAIAIVEGDGSGGDAVRLLRQLIQQQAEQQQPQHHQQHQNSILDTNKLTRVISKLGQGGMGAAYHCIYAQNDVVVKEVLAGGDMTRFLSEINIQLTIHHPNLVGVIGVAHARIMPSDDHHSSTYRIEEDATRWVMITQYCAKGSLNDWLKRCKVSSHFNEFLAVRFMEEVALGMAILHDRNIVHMDLKPDNIFISADNRAMVGDFGLATHLNSSSRKLNCSDIMATLTTKFEGGTLFYIDPDCFEKGTATRYADVYSFAIILHNVFITQSDDETYNALDVLGPEGQINRFVELFHRKVRDGLRPKLTPPSSSSAAALSERTRGVVCELMVACWAKNPRDRPKFEDIVVTLRALRESLEDSQDDAGIVERSGRKEIIKPKEEWIPLEQNVTQLISSNSDMFASLSLAPAPAKERVTGDWRPPSPPPAAAPVMPPAALEVVAPAPVVAVPPFQLIPAVNAIKAALSLDASMKLSDTLEEAARILGIEEEISALKTAREKAVRIKTELGV